MADCYNYDCPFRQNESSNANRCECVACPNRNDKITFFATNRTAKDGKREDGEVH